MRAFLVMYNLVDRSARLAALAGTAALIGAVALTVADILLRGFSGIALRSCATGFDPLCTERRA